MGAEIKAQFHSISHAGIDPRASASQSAHLLHPAWRSFLRFCAELQHGDIEHLKIQDGLPVLAEVTKKKVKFNS